MILSPLSCAYYAGHKIKWSLSKPYKSGIPVLCIGGIVAGGSGKTPTLHAILKLIHEHGLFKKPVILLRGYGGTMKEPVIVDLQNHDFHNVGDEALLHAALATTIVSAERAEGAKLAEEIGADIILMDDGLQNNTIQKDVSMLVINGGQGLGNGKMIPAGPLREPLCDALDRVDAIIQIHGNAPSTQKPVLNAHIKPIVHLDKARSYFGFAGIGDPDKFKNTLLDIGLDVKDFVHFADHHPYTSNDIDRLRRQAKGNTLITTAKDYIRIPASFREGIEILPIELTFDAPDDVLKILRTLA